MRLAKSFGTVVGLLALLAWGASHLGAQTSPPAKAPQPSKQPSKQPDKQPAKTPPAAKPATPAPAKMPVGDKQRAKKPAKAKAAKPQPAAGAQPRVARRDPFDPLVGKDRSGSGGPDRLPPGKAGLVVSALRLDGIVRGPNGMIAVVSNPQQRVYFLREGDQLYDGKVEHITLEGVAFHEIGKDAFGKPVDRQVTKRLYQSPGEQQ